jgi:hypothetical protein
MPETDWNFCDVITEAGYFTRWLSVSPQGDFIYEERWTENGARKKLGVAFRPEELEQFKGNRAEYVRAVIERARRIHHPTDRSKENQGNPLNSA